LILLFPRALLVLTTRLNQKSAKPDKKVWLHLGYTEPALMQHTNLQKVNKHC